MTHSKLTPDPLEKMPEGLRRIAEITSVASAIELSRTYGGRGVYVPSVIPLDHPIVAAMGVGHAEALAQEFGGDFIDIPKHDFVRRMERDHGIRRRKGSGETAVALSIAYGLTERQIWRICGVHDDD